MADPNDDLISIVEQEGAKPAAKAGWYPDPTQPDTQRYWDGSVWTEQRAPLGAPTAASQASTSKPGALPFSAILVFIGAAIAVIGTFLPWVESPTIVPVRGNSLIQNGDGWVIVAIALAVAGAAYAERRNVRRNWWAVIGGAIIVGLAIYHGTGDQLTLTFANGQQASGSPAIGIYAVGLGGLGVIFGGFRED